MKLLLIVLLVCGAGGVGYIYKQKLQKEYNFLCFVCNFANFYNANMTLFKNSVVEVIEKFESQNNTKPSGFNIFIKQNGVYVPDSAKVSKLISDKSAAAMVCEYLSNIGKNEYEFEREKNLQFERYVSDCKEKSKSKLETKGSLYFKLALLFGAMLGIIIW